MKNIFYVYAHYEENGTLRYIGKGCKKRAYTNYGRSPLWDKIFPSGPYKIEFFGKDLSEEDAFSLETKMIFEAHERGDPLINLSIGGYNETIWAFTDETRDYIAETRAGENHWAWGKERDPEVIKKLNEGKDRWIVENGHPRLGAKLSEEHKAKFFEKSHTPEAIAKRVEKMTGRKHTPEHNAKIGRKGELNANFGIKYSEARCKQMSESRIGIPRGPMTDECKAKISAATMGRRPLTAEEQARRLATWRARGMVTKKAKSLMCIESGIIYRSAKAAADALGLSDKHIQACCVGRRARHGKLTFKYVT
jgi:NUMOD3 motif